MTSLPIQAEGALTLDELRDIWIALSSSERLEGFRLLRKPEAEDFFLGLGAGDMAELICGLPRDERRSWMRLTPPDDAADLIQRSPPGQREHLLGLLDEPTRKEVAGLLAYREDEAGGLMNPRYARLRPEMTVDEAISYLRRQARAHLETIYYVYVVGEDQRLLGVVSLKQLFAAKPDKTVSEVMRTDLVTVGEHTDQEAVSRLFARHDLLAIPVLDADGRMKGLVTVDDIVDVVQEEATEDAQKFGGMEALDAPYLKIAFFRMVKKRAGWLAALFIGEMLTATALAHYEAEISRAVVLALFMPLITSSGGNAGSQASTLVIRAMALGELTLRDWWRVIRRELAAGLLLGIVLGGIGFCRIFLWQQVSPTYGEHYRLVALTVFVSLIGVVAVGSVTGSLLPFVLRRLRLDPASASAPFVATLVDVTGLIIYFSVAATLLRGTLL
jgi:magnesium transporter